MQIKILNYGHKLQLLNFNLNGKFKTQVKNCKLLNILEKAPKLIKFLEYMKSKLKNIIYHLHKKE